MNDEEELSTGLWWHHPVLLNGKSRTMHKREQLRMVGEGNAAQPQIPLLISFVGLTTKSKLTICNNLYHLFSINVPFG